MEPDETTATSDMDKEKKTSIDAVSVEVGHAETLVNDKSMERRLLLKRDLIMLPTVGLLYMIVRREHLHPSRSKKRKTHPNDAHL